MSLFSKIHLFFLLICAWLSPLMHAAKITVSIYSNLKSRISFSQFPDSIIKQLPTAFLKPCSDDSNYSSEHMLSLKLTAVILEDLLVDKVLPFAFLEIIHFIRCRKELMMK